MTDDELRSVARAISHVDLTSDYLGQILYDRNCSLHISDDLALHLAKVAIRVMEYRHGVRS